MILLDTNAWLYLVGHPERLSIPAAQAIRDHSADLAISAASVWEIGTKARKGKLALGTDLRDWIAAATAFPGLRVIPVGADDALESCLLPDGYHDDPFDRLIIAMARRRAWSLVTSDQAMHRYPHVITIW